VYIPNARRDALSAINNVLRWLTMVLVIVAVACTMGLLTSDTKLAIPLGFSAQVISAAPLLLIGVSLLIVQTMLRPRWTELLKNILLAAAFILWGVVQLMQESALSKRLGDVVIALYVLDLAWMILASVNPAGTIRSSPLGPD
jgi:peptidoglycan/LPS O-acetylase OafA/YrhL